MQARVVFNRMRPATIFPFRMNSIIERYQPTSRIMLSHNMFSRAIFSLAMFSRYSVVLGQPILIAVLTMIFIAALSAQSLPGNETDSRSVSFELDVQPILTATGCNGGGCHGKQRGQNGFQLSLFGFDSDYDYAAITREARGRRVFPAAPEKSLLLLKATAELPHGGGRRINKGDRNYRILKDWLVQGRRRRLDDEATLVSIRLNTTSELLKPGQAKALSVTARYSDGTTRDVTDVTTYQSNDPAIVAVDSTGKMVAGKLPGETAIMARYMNIFAVCHVAIPLDTSVESGYYERLPRYNYVDDLVWRKLKRLNLKPSGGISDAKFMRRVYTDIIGRLPTATEARKFLTSQELDKRRKLVDRLLEMPEYAEFMANKWADLLRTNPYRVGIKTTLNYDHWIRQQFRNNVPYDRFVRSLITARGSTFRKGAVTLFRDRRTPDELTTMTTQLFLGIRLECAKCHHHPFEKWSQDDFYGFAAFFAGVGRKGTGLSPPISGSEEIILETGRGRVTHPVSGAVMDPKPLFGSVDLDTQPIGKGLVTETRSVRTLRESLADWITSPDNPYFARVEVNRIWADLMGRGLVEPVDDMRATNPPSNEELLDALARDFAEHDFDLKHMIRTICTSYVYGLSSLPSGENVSDRLNYSRHYRHRLRAEVLLDSLATITGQDSRFAALPSGSRAMEIWTHRTGSLFLDTFGRPNPNEDPPCERTREFTMTQSLHLMNAEDIHRRLQAGDSTAERLADANMNVAKIVEEIYLMIYSRFPDDREKKFAIGYLNGDNRNEEQNQNETLTSARKSTARSLPPGGKAVDKSVLKKRIVDLMWAMINTPEFSIQD